MKRISKKESMLQNVKNYIVLDYSYFSGILFGMLIKEIEETHFQILKNIGNAKEIYWK